jgi:membrane protein DedA with SNARE-associated domain
MSHAVLEYLLANGMLYVFVFLVAAGFGLPLPEDIMLLAAGVLVQRGDVSYVQALIVCAVGVFLGDTGIFLIARRLGPTALERRPLSWILTPARREIIEEKFARHGNVIVFMARHMAGLRAPTFAVAGMHDMKLTTFWLWDGLGLCVSAPVVIGVGYWLADNLGKAEKVLDNAKLVIGAVIVVGLIAFFVWRKLRRNGPAHEHEPRGG